MKKTVSVTTLIADLITHASCFAVERFRRMRTLESDHSV